MSVSKVKEIISQRGWCKGAMEKDDGSVCLLGAIREANIETHQHPMWHHSADIPTLGKVIKEQYPDRVPQYPDSHDDAEYALWVHEYDNVWVFNDHADTTREDIERVLEKAAVEDS